MRTKNSIYNILSNFSVFFVKTVLTFITRNILISQISQTYVGVNGLFTNVLSLLSLADLGISSAIGFSLYKPLSEKNNNEISSLMSFYRKSYAIVGSIIFIIGLCIMPFLGLMVKEPVNNLHIIYILFLINTSSLYFLSYKDVLITSDQKSYMLTKINLIFTILLNAVEIAILLVTKKYILYLIIQLVVNLLQRIVTNIYITKKYPDIDYKTNKKLEQTTKNEIFKNIKAMFYHKIGDGVINSTDNIIISSFININAVAMYSNYLLVITYLTSFANMIYNGLLASLGNLIVKENEEKRYQIFQKTNFLGFTIFSYSAVILVNIFNSFIHLYAGENYVLEMSAVIIIIINFYVTGLRIPVGNIKTAAGLFDIDKFTPLIQSLINIVFSIILAKYWGLTGVLIGTFLSSILPSIQRPYFVYKYILNRSCKEYFINYGKYALFTIGLAIITIFINSYITISSNILVLIIKFISTSIIYLIIYIIVYRKNTEFNYFKNFILENIKLKK